MALEIEATGSDESTGAPSASRDAGVDLASALRILQHVEFIRPEPSTVHPEYAFRHTLAGGGSRRALE